MHMQSVDDLDRHLLELLQENCRRSDRELARLAGTTGPTVANRIARLESAGIIQGYTVRLDKDAFVQVGDQVAVPCHWCQQRTTAPRWARIGAKEHPFCCPTCQSAFSQRHDELSKGL